jgi:hypothetical protein
VFFDTRAFYNFTKTFREQIVGGFLGPGFIFDGIFGVSRMPPFLVLPLAALAFILLFREDIGSIIDDKICKFMHFN